MLTLNILSILILNTCAKLQIMSPESLKSLFKDGVIPATYANFGYIPYGKTIMGKIHFDLLNEYGCEDYPIADRTELSRSDDITPFFISKRGG